MHSNLIDSKNGYKSVKSRVKRWQSRIPLWAQGPASALLAVAILRLTVLTPLQPFMPFPVTLLVIAVIYSVFRSGVRSGIISAVLSIAYLAYFLNITHAYESNFADALNRLISWAVGLPIIVAIVGILKERSNESAKSFEREQSLREITEAMPQIVWAANSQGIPVFCNQHWFDYTGRSQTKNFGIDWNQVLHPDDVPESARSWKEALVTGKDYEREFRFLRKVDQRYRWHLVRATAIRDEEGYIQRWVGTCTDIHTQKESESKIKEVQQRMKLIVEHASGVIWAVDKAGVFTLSAGAGLRLVNLKDGERVGSNLFDVYNEEHDLAKGARLALSGQSTKAISEIRGVWFESSVSPLRDADGVITGCVGVSIDVTARIESESAKAQLLATEQAARLIRESESKFKGAFENAPIGIGLATLDGQWVDVNPALCEMLGYDRNELLENTFDDLTPPEDIGIGAEAKRDIAAGLVEKMSYEKRYIHKNGKLVSVWINGTTIRNDWGDIKSLLIQAVDITERKRAEKELRETTQRFQSLVTSSPVAMLTLDHDSKVTVWNPACEKMFGWTASEAIGKVLPFVPDDRRHESVKIIDKINQNREPIFFEANRVKKDGTPLNTGTAAIPLTDDSGKVIGLMAVMMDVTERVRAQQDLLEANQALQVATNAKSEFLANMSHEIRTPINGVIGMTGLLLDMELGSEQKGYAETIRTSAEMLLSLINDILDFSKIEAGKFDIETIDFDLNEITQNIERLLSVSARKKGLKLLRAISPELPTTLFRGDPTRISQVLANLISNAVKFTEKGQVVIEILHDVTGGAVLDTNHVRLRVEVTDTGIGMSAQALARMFQPFSQADASTSRKFGGTGLGLSICKRLVELMGGEIGVRSREGEGSTFWFNLVLEKSKAKTLSVVVEAPVELKLSSAKPIRILLAEDNTVNQIIAIKMLEKNGFRVDAVANGDEAVHAVHSFPYDLILMDCQMPELDGYEASRKIRQSKDARVANIPIIAMTANALTGDREKCLDAGMSDYVTKPIKANDLANAIQQLLAKSIAA